MKGGIDSTFRGSAAITGGTLAVLLFLAWAAPILISKPYGRLPANIVAVSRGRAIFFNAAVTGYYERLFQKIPVQRHARIFDSFRVLRLRPNSTPTINRFGFTGPEYSIARPPDTRRVALLGDSLTQGVAVEVTRLYGSLLQDRLNEVHPLGPQQRFEVMNFAIGGYKITEITDVALVDAHRFQPDVYMLALTELAVYINWSVHLSELVQKGLDPKYDFLRDIVRRAGAKKTDDTLTLNAKFAPYRLPVLRWGLETLNSLAQRDHARFIVLLMPSVQDGDVSRRRFEGIPALLASLGVPAVDLLDTFAGIADPERLRINPFDVHPNTEGHAMIFENLYARLRAQPDLWQAVTGASH
ncbi:MAG: SGNH/GDSL hydrolase family protein [Acidobacteriota bacterium]|nr:SGNH/GDSL hydrolase family protein [Acidobacteriota bacterium]